MAKTPSMKRQTQMAINKINLIGHSKRADKQSGNLQGIYSTKYMKDVLNTSYDFTKFTKEQFGTKYLYNITEDHYRAYMAFKQAEGVSYGHMINIESHLRKLQQGMDKMLKQPTKFAPDKRLYNPSSRPAGVDRSITPEAFDKLRNHVSDNVREILDMQYNLGFRLKEATNIRVEHVVRDSEGNMRIEIAQAKGITKGGRPRSLPVPKHFESRLTEIIGNKAHNERVANVGSVAVRQALSRYEKSTGDKIGGSHAFRHSYSRNRFSEIMGKEAASGRAMLDKFLDERGRLNAERRQECLEAYRQSSLFREVEKACNTIHEEIGHGKGRWDLAEVYLK